MSKKITGIIGESLIFIVATFFTFTYSCRLLSAADDLAVAGGIGLLFISICIFVYGTLKVAKHIKEGFLDEK
jgi:hypothetical protein